MFCEKCGKEIPNESKFCKFCGAKIIVGESFYKKEAEKAEGDKEETKKLSDENNFGIWDKFAEIYDSKEDERRRYESYTASDTWELVNRLGVNSFERFIEENKEALNKQPYTVIEKIKSAFYFTVLGGYWFWIAEEFIKSKDLKKTSGVNIDNLAREWENITSNIFKDNPNIISNEVSGAMEIFHKFQMNLLFESSPSIKELTNEFIEKLRGSLMIQLLWGYCVGIAESKYRK